MRFEVVSRLSTEKKLFCFGKKNWKKKGKKRIFRREFLSSVRHTPFTGNTETTTQNNERDERSKKVDSSDGQSSGGESSRGDENERGDFVARNRRK